MEKSILAGIAGRLRRAKKHHVEAMQQLEAAQTRLDDARSAVNAAARTITDLRDELSREAEGETPHYDMYR